MQRIGVGTSLLAALLLMGCTEASTNPGSSWQVWRSTWSTVHRKTISETVSQRGEATLRGDGEAHPWQDGQQFATVHWDGELSTLRIFRTSDGDLLHELKRAGLMTSLEPSPRAKRIAFRFGKSTLGPFEWIVYDFEAQRAIARFDSAGPGWSWISEQRFMLVDTDGAVSLGDVAGTIERVGRVPLPTGRTVSNAWLSPNGNDLLLRLELNSQTKTRESDLWMLRKGKKGLERFTATKMSTFAAWSPDGSRVAFTVDSGAWCAAAHCTGSCEVWHADASARDIRANGSQTGADRFRVRLRDSIAPMACDLRGWTR